MTNKAPDHIPTEHEEQRTFIQWFRRKFPDVRIFAIPNGGARSPSVACRLKAEGVSRGVPDLFIPAWRLFIEMKRVKGGVVSEDQYSWKEYLEANGYRVVICAGCEAAQKEVDEWQALRSFSTAHV